MSRSRASTVSRPASTSNASSLMQDVPGAYPQSLAAVDSNQQSLSQAIYSRRADFTRPKTIRIKVGTWNTASFKGTEKDIGAWFVDGKGVAEELTNLDIADPENAAHADHAADNRETVEAQESRYRRKLSTVPKNDPGSLPGGDEIGLYCLGLQEVVDVNSASEALRPYTDPSVSAKWQKAIANVMPSGYQLVAEQQLLGLLLLIYASREVAADVKSVSTTSVGTGLMGYMGNKGAVTARLVLGDTTRLVFINCHMAAGADKASADRRNWDYAQILSRTRFDPIQDSMDLIQNTGEQIGDEDIAFWVGDLNYRLEGVPGDDIRRILMLHTRNQYDLSKGSTPKVDEEIDIDSSIHDEHARQRASTTSSSSLYSAHRSGVDSPIEDILDPSSNPASLQATLDSLLPHDELQQMQKARKAFHDGWKEGPITFLPTYKYDAGSVGVFDSSEKRRAPSWCDRILYRTRRDRLAYETLLLEEEESRQKDLKMREAGLDEAGKDEELLYDYDPDTDVADDSGSVSDLAEPSPGVVITREGFEDELHLEYYTAHQRVLSSDHKPLDAVFKFKYDAVVPQLKAGVHQEVVRELDREENDNRPNVTVVVDRHHAKDHDATDDDPARFEGVYFGGMRYAQKRQRSLTIANTGRVPAVFSFVERPVGDGQAPGIAPAWLSMTMDQQEMDCSERTSPPHRLEPGETCNIELRVRILDVHLVKDLNEGTRLLEDILVLRVENGRDHFIPVRGKWTESSLGRSIDKLIRIPEGGIRKLQRQKPDSSKNRGLAPEDLPVKWSAPREVFRLTDAAEVLIEKSVAEWSMTASDRKPPWLVTPGWPFVKDSWSDMTEQKHDQMCALSDALDTDQPLEHSYLSETSQVDRLECLSRVLVQFLQNIPDGVVTTEIWDKVEGEMIEQEKQKTSYSQEDQRSWIQETVSESPPHSVTLIMLMSMLDRVVREIVNASGQSQAALPEPAPKFFAAIRKKDNKDPAAALRQIQGRALASVFADAAIRSQAPATARERSAQEERKIKVIEMFIARDPA